MNGISNYPHIFNNINMYLFNVLNLKCPCMLSVVSPEILKYMFIVQHLKVSDHSELVNNYLVGTYFMTLSNIIIQ